jgi:glutathione peroxidase-family protein
MQMNDLTDQFGDKFVVLGFPSNQVSRHMPTHGKYVGGNRMI